MLNSGYLEKGDIIWIFDRSENTISSTHHIGIYWGDGHSDCWWHSIAGHGNAISSIYSYSNNPHPYVVLKTGGTGTLKLAKTSAYPNITNNNSCYNMYNSWYHVYSQSGNDIAWMATYNEEYRWNKTVSLGTDWWDFGNTDYLTLSPGKYKVVEEQNAGIGYEVNNTPNWVTITPGKTSWVGKDSYVYGRPIVDKSNFGILKNRVTSDPNESVEGAEYTLKFYGNDDGLDNVNKKPLHTWVLKTNRQGRALLQNSYKTNNDSFYTMDGKIVLPLGTLLIQETKAPKDGILERPSNWNSSMGNSYSAPIYARVISADSNGTVTTTVTPNAPIFESLGNTNIIWRRLCGPTCFETAAAISNETFGSTDTVIIATWDGYWDALSAACLAGTESAPILFADGDDLPKASKNEIKRLNPSKAIIVGGTSAVPRSIEKQLKALGLSVTRYQGATAVQTAIDIAEATQKKAKSDTCIIATPDGYYDALSIAPISYAKKMPIYLANFNTGNIGKEALRSIKKGGFSNAIIVGGTAAISNQTQSDLKNAGLKVTRLEGVNAWETSAKVAKYSIQHGMTMKNVAVADGNGYWDSLTGAVLCGVNNSPLVLVPHDGPNSDGSYFSFDPYAFNAVVKPHENKVEVGYIFGGTSVVPGF